MGLESTTTIAGLNDAWPIATDPVGAGDDHIRTIKTVLKTMFPGSGTTGFSIPITATETELNYVNGVTSPIQAQLDAKAPLASPALTGVPTVPTATPLTSNTQAASTAYVDAAVTAIPDKPDTAKCWIKCNSAEVIQASHNISSITDTGTGVVTITMTTSFTTTDYCITPGIYRSLYGSVTATITSSSVFVLRCFDSSHTASDPTSYFAAAFGDQ